MEPARAVLVGTMVLAVLAPAVTAGYVAPTVTAGTVADEGATGVGDAPETDNTVTRIAVQPDGDARWTVRIRTRLDSDEDVEQYRRFQEEFRGNTSRFLDPFSERMRAVVDGARTATGREMNATDFAASTTVQEVPRRWGIVSFSFTWTNFARVDGDRLVVGDVFEGGFFLGRNDSLVVEAPAGYAIETAGPQPGESDDAAVTWIGREDFADGRPRVVIEPAVTPTMGTPTPSPDASAGGLPLGLLGLAAVGLLAGLGAALYVRRGERGDVPTAGDGGDQQVMTDAERVEEVLAENGGRMKQAAVADALGWSASKTSRVVGDMVEDGHVEKLRVGRENVLDLPE